MNKLKMKAKAGVTLIELLVVVLIVTILSVALLPLLQPFVVESQYAAEAIPVIGNLRTKIGVYQYDKTKLPQHTEGSVETDDGTGGKTKENSPLVETWAYTTGSGVSDEITDSYIKATFPLVGATSNVTLKAYVSSEKVDGKQISHEHIGSVLDIGVEDLKGKRSRPVHYEYVVIKNGADYIYALGVFGDGNGLKLGTGYAVCEINLPSAGRKYVGTWKRYKPVCDARVHFTDITDPVHSDDEKSTVGCPLSPNLRANISAEDGEEPTVISDMRAFGWEF